MEDPELLFLDVLTNDLKFGGHRAFHFVLLNLHDYGVTILISGYR